MINVPDRPYIDVRLAAIKLFLTHDSFSKPLKAKTLAANPQ
jgi:hypothetical protein